MLRFKASIVSSLPYSLPFNSLSLEFRSIIWRSLAFISVSSYMILLVYSLEIALITDSCYYWLLTSSWENFASISSVIPEMFSRKPFDISSCIWEPSSSAISGFIDSTAPFISFWFFKFWEITVFWSFITVYTTYWSYLALVSCWLEKTLLSFNIWVIS